MRKMATLSDQTRYTLSCSQPNAQRISVLLVKLSDKALQAIEDHRELVSHPRNSSSKQRPVQGKGSRGKTLPLQPTIHFKGSQGCIKIPNTDLSSDSYHKFDFVMSNVDKDHPQGSFECLQQAPSSSGASSLASMATVKKKLTVGATDDSPQMSQERATQGLEDTHRANVSKLAKQYKGKQVPVRKPAPQSTVVAPERKRSTPINPAKTIRKCLSQNSVSQRPFRDRVIHLLALRSFKKLELVARLQRDGIHQKDSKSLGTTLQQVANLNPRENSYTLKEFLFRDVQRDWPGYSETERSQIDQILERKLGIPSSSRKDSDTSSSQKRQGDFVNPLAPKKARISHFTNQEPTVSSASPHSRKDKSSGSTKRLSPPNSDTPGSSTSLPSSSHPSTSSNSNSPCTPEGCGIQDLPVEPGFFFSSLSTDGIMKALSPCPSLRSCTSPTSPTAGTSSMPSPTQRKIKKKSKKHKEKDQEREKGKRGAHGSKSSVKKEEQAEERTRHKKKKRSEQESRRSPRQEEPVQQSEEVVIITDSDQDDCRSAASSPGWKYQALEEGKWTNQGGRSPEQAEQTEGTVDIVVITDSDQDDCRSAENSPGWKHPKVEEGKQTDQGNRSPEQAEQTEGRREAGVITETDQACKTEKGKRIDRGIRCHPRQAEQAEGRSRFSAEESGRISPRQAEQDEGKSKSKKGKRMDRSRKSSPKRAEQADRRPRSSTVESREEARMTDISQDNERPGQSSEAHSLPDYVQKYVPLVSMSQRDSYKQDYMAEYNEYCRLHAIVGNISAHFNELEDQCSKLKQGTDEYEKFCKLMRKEYTKITKEHPDFQLQKERFLYLHEKLSHIKQLISDFDKQST